MVAPAIEAITATNTMTDTATSPRVKTSMGIETPFSFKLLEELRVLLNTDFSTRDDVEEMGSSNDISVSEMGSLYGFGIGAMGPLFDFELLDTGSCCVGVSEMDSLYDVEILDLGSTNNFESLGKDSP